MLDSVSWKCADGRIVRAFQPDLAGLPGKLRLIDQTLLPEQLCYVELADATAIHDAIVRLVVRGAPAIGCAAAVGLAAVCRNQSVATPAAFLALARRTADYLAGARPTAVNLSWALRRCLDSLEAKTAAPVERLQDILLQTALNILQEDIELCRAIGNHGATLLQDGMGILTHCNAGALATGDYGTALAPLYVAAERGLKLRVFSDETRPLLQGSRLTAWELHQAGIDVTVICDNMAAQVMKEKRIDLVIVGADRISANGDTANKIGTYMAAVLAHHHRIPFYVAAPYSTFDPATPDGDGIVIEQRPATEISRSFGKITAPEQVRFYNPAFDVTPHELIAGFITERGILRPPFARTLAAAFA